MALALAKMKIVIEHTAEEHEAARELALSIVDWQKRKSGWLCPQLHEVIE